MDNVAIPPPPPPELPERRRLWQVDAKYIMAMGAILVLSLILAGLEALRVYVRVQTGHDDAVLATMVNGALGLFGTAMGVAVATVLRALSKNGDSSGK